MIEAIRKILERRFNEPEHLYNVFDYITQGKMDVDEMSEEDENRFLKSAEVFDKRMEW